MRKNSVIIVAILCLLQLSCQIAAQKKSRRGNQKVTVITNKLSEAPLLMKDTTNIKALLNWHDLQGPFVAVAMVVNKGKFFSKEYSSAIAITKYRVINKATQKLWQWNDSASNVGGTVYIIPDSFVTTDCDVDGVAELHAMYYTVFDGLDPMQLRYVVIVDSSIALFTGSLAPDEIDGVREYTTKPGKGFESLPDTLKCNVRKRWNVFLHDSFSFDVAKKYNKNIAIDNYR